MSQNHASTSDDQVGSILAAAADLLSRVSFDRMLPGEIAEHGAALRVVRGRVDLAQASYASRIAELNDDGHAAEPITELGKHGDMSNKDAAKAARHAEILKLFPAFAAALGDGKVSSGHVDVLSQHHRILNESDRALLLVDIDKLIRQAVRMTVDEFRRALVSRKAEADAKNQISESERQHRKNKATGGYDPYTNRYQWQLDLDREQGARVETAITAEIERMRRTGDIHDLHPDLVAHDSHLRAYAFRNLISRGFQVNARTSDGLAEIGVIIDAQTLGHGAHDHSVCELTDGYPFPIETARRLACTAGMYPIVLNGAGQVLDLGREQRLADRTQRRALRAMYRTCAGTGCDVPFDKCQIHHILWWENGGPTDIANLVPLCTRHHHLVHEGGFRIHLDDARTLHFYTPHGDHHSSQPYRPATTPTTTAAGGNTSGAPPGTPTGRPPDPHRPPGSRPGDPLGDPGGPPGQQLTLVS